MAECNLLIIIIKAPFFAKLKYNKIGDNNGWGKNRTGFSGTFRTTEK
jgi:hypothetical protein